MKNTNKGYIMQIFYCIPILGHIIGRLTDDYFFMHSNFVDDAIEHDCIDDINKWVIEHPNMILKNTKVKEIIRNTREKRNIKDL